jgi:hypothetical protein
LFEGGIAPGREWPTGTPKYTQPIEDNAAQPAAEGSLTEIVL